MVVIQALLLLLFWLLLFWLLLVLLLVLSNPNCVPTPDPCKINDGHNSHIAFCDVDNITGKGVVAAVVAPAPAVGLVVVPVIVVMMLMMIMMMICIIIHLLQIT